MPEEKRKDGLKVLFAFGYFAETKDKTKAVKKAAQRIVEDLGPIASHFSLAWVTEPEKCTYASDDLITLAKEEIEKCLKKRKGNTKLQK